MGGKYTDAQKNASKKYLMEKTDNIQLRVKKGTKERWMASAEKRGKSLTQFVVELVEQEIEKD